MAALSVGMFCFIEVLSPSSAPPRHQGVSCTASCFCWYFYLFLHAMAGRGYPPSPAACRHRSHGWEGTAARRGGQQGGRSTTVGPCALQGGSLGAESSSSHCSLGSQPEVKPSAAPEGTGSGSWQMPSSQVMPSKSPLYKAADGSTLTAGKDASSMLLVKQLALTSPGSRLGCGA